MFFKPNFYGHHPPCCRWLCTRSACSDVKSVLKCSWYLAWIQGASGNRKTSTYGTYLPRFERQQKFLTAKTMQKPMKHLFKLPKTGPKLPKRRRHYNKTADCTSTIPIRVFWLAGSILVTYLPLFDPLKNLHPHRCTSSVFQTPLAWIGKYSAIFAVIYANGPKLLRATS
jgi:hypothetical protein